MHLAAVKAGVRFVLADEPTFFEKKNPDELEIDCRLGDEQGQTTSRFALHRRFVWQYHSARARYAANRLGSGTWTHLYDNFSYIDEFHYRSGTIAWLAEYLAAEIV
jgi:hypothetical protein